MLNKRIKWLRETNKLAQKEVAAEMGLSLNGYQKIEYGDREPKIEGLVKLSKLYEVSIDFLVGLDDHTKYLKTLQKQLIGLDHHMHYLAGECGNIIRDIDGNLRFSDIEYVKKREVIEVAIMRIEKDYDYMLRDYVNQIVSVPDFNPYRNKLLMDLFPIKFKVSEEFNKTYTVRIFNKKGKEFNSRFAKRYEDYAAAKKEEEYKNSLVSKFWENGIAPEEGDVQMFLV